jgi:hypothetical protein
VTLDLRISKKTWFYIYGLKEVKRSINIFFQVFIFKLVVCDKLESGPVRNLFFTGQRDSWFEGTYLNYTYNIFLSFLSFGKPSCQHCYISRGRIPELPHEGYQQSWVARLT